MKVSDLTPEEKKRFAEVLLTQWPWLAPDYDDAVDDSEEIPDELVGLYESLVR